MGNISSSGTNNDDLVDRLRLLGYIKSKQIEHIFRAVDRGHYISSDDKNGVYTDLSWKVGNIHLSAPCVYGRVMEGLSLKSGLSFLNIGSGTGYLSTMAGLILNCHGTNHGVELNKDCVEFAYKKLEEFKKKSHALDQFDFCEPVFIYGNFCKVLPNRRYDRVYCGAECPESYEMFVKQFVKVGGILIMPYKGHLLRIERIDEDIWKHQVMLSVSFAPIIIPKDTSTDSADHTSFQLPLSKPLSLQELSRFSIRCEIRKKLWIKQPELESEYLINRTKASLDHQNKSSFLSESVSTPYSYKFTTLPVYEESPDNKTIINGIKDKYNKSIMTNQSQSLLYSLKKIKGQMIFTKTISPVDFTNNTSIDVDLFKLAEENSISGKLTDFSLKQCSVTDTKYLLACLKNFPYNNIHIDMTDESYKKTRHTADIIQCDDNYLSENTNKWGIPCSDCYTVPQQQKSELLNTDYSTMQSVCDNDAEDIQSNQIYYAHKVNGVLLSYYIKQNIFQLPLPMALRLYVNYNHPL